MYSKRGKKEEVVLDLPMHGDIFTSSVTNVNVNGVSFVNL